MSFIIDCLAREQDEAIQAALHEGRYLDGSNDAAFGNLPQYADDMYLQGYVAALKKLPTNADGRLQHYSPRQHFAFGYIDSPDPDCCNEF
jgi:hypothetical protein